MDVAADGSVSVDFVPTDGVRWLQVDVPVDEYQSDADLLDGACDQCLALQEGGEDRALKCPALEDEDLPAEVRAGVMMDRADQKLSDRQRRARYAARRVRWYAVVLLVVAALVLADSMGLFGRRPRKPAGDRARVNSARPTRTRFYSARNPRIGSVPDLAGDCGEMNPTAAPFDPNDEGRSDAFRQLVPGQES